jgi:hypothetical protein
LAEKERLLIQSHLDELLESQAFAGSRRRQAFLRYVVEETLAGRGAAIKETTIAVDVFGRNSDFDARSASVVRVTAAEVRKRLAQAYSSGPGRTVRIELPVGGYQPTFHFVSPEDAAMEPELPVGPPPSRRPRWLLIGAAGLGVAGLLLVVQSMRRPSPIDLLWKPFLSKDTPVLISLVSPTVLYLANPEKWLPLQPSGAIPASEVEVMESRVVGTGGALGAALFAEQLASRKQRFVLKFGGDMTFADLKQSPAVLIGASRWTRELTRNLRFRIQGDGERTMVVDSQQPDQAWAISRRNASAARAEGYSLVTRLLRSESGYPILLAVGLDVRNTQAAVEFLSKADSFNLFARKARGWEDQNFQVVLYNTIHGNSPGSLTVVAWHTW